MRPVVLVILLGLAVGALGLAAADLYVAGVLILFLGVIGAAVVAGDRLMRYARGRQPPAAEGTDAIGPQRDRLRRGNGTDRRAGRNHPMPAANLGAARPARFVMPPATQDRKR